MLYVFNALFLCMITIFLSLYSHHKETWKIVLSYVLTLLLTSIIITPFFSWLCIFAYFIILEFHILYIVGKQPTKSLPLFVIPLLYSSLMFILYYMLEMISGKQRLLFSLLVLCFINILVLLIFAMYLKKMKHEQEVFLNISIYFLIFFVFEIDCMHQKLLIEVHDMTLFISVLGIMLSNFMVLYILYKIIAFQNKESELVLSKNREEALLMKYESMKQHYESQFCFVHELLHQCTRLEADVRKQDYQHLKEELKQLNDHVFTQFNLLYSNSAILNYAISEHMDEIKQYDIYIKTVMEYNDFSFLPLTTQTVLFTYLLEEAMRAVKEVSEHRMIAWKTKRIDDQVLLQCSFTSEKKLDEEVFDQHVAAMLCDVDQTITTSYDENTRMVKVFLVFQGIE